MLFFSTATDPTPQGPRNVELGLTQGGALSLVGVYAGNQSNYTGLHCVYIQTHIHTHVKINDYLLSNVMKKIYIQTSIYIYIYIYIYILILSHTHTHILTSRTCNWRLQEQVASGTGKCRRASLAETGVRIPDTESVNDTRDSRVVT